MHQSFLSSLKTREQQKIALFSFLLHLVLFFIFRSAYPFPMTTGDTGSYILVAQNGIYGGVRPEGYSWFLSFFHSLTTAFSGIAVLQFWFQAIAVTFLILVIRYVFRTLSGMGIYIFSALIICSPFSLYLTHWIMSDSVFISLTCLYAGTLLLLLKRFGIALLILHAVIIYLAIYVRFAGLVYPLISITSILFIYRKQHIWWNLLLLVIPFWIHSDMKKKTREIYGQEIFSAFGGWARANNAVSVIPYIRSDKPPAKPALRYVHNIVTAFPDSMYNWTYIKHTSFMWRREHAGKTVLFSLGNERPFASYTHAWIKTGEMLGDYGSYLMGKYPGKFFRYFLLPNTAQVFWPSVTVGPFEEKEADELIRSWYKGEFSGIMKPDNDFMAGLGGFLKVYNLFFWLLFVGGILFNLKLRSQPEFKRALFVSVVLTLTFTAFSIVAHPVHLRYLLPLYPLMLIPALWFFRKKESTK